MAKKHNSAPAVEEADEQKKRKKQAKKEARMMLEIEGAKVSIQKAEKKLAKAQATLEARNTHLHTLEVELSEFRASHEETQVKARPGDLEQETEVTPQSDDSKKETETEAQPHGSEQVTAELTSADEEATIVPDAGFDHQSGQPELEEATPSNQ